MRILFVCVHNSARSQIAEGLANSIGKGKVLAVSAGSQPTDVHPFAIRAMEEIGVDISGQFSKSFADIANLEFDYVITLCAEGDLTCPVFPGKYQRLSWPMPDPSSAAGSPAEKLSAFREVRDAIKEALEIFLKAR